MKMKKIIILILILVSFESYSQTEYSDLYLEYVVNQNGKTKIGQFHKLKKGSVFYYVDTSNVEIKNSEEYVENGINYIVNLTSGSKIHGVVETDLINEETLSSERIFNNSKYQEYIVKEDLSFIKWNLFPENKKIGKFNCSKAVGKYKGREYIVWYSKDIPIMLGPWKLHGLPGVIVEANDSENYIQFNLVKANFKNQEFSYTPLSHENSINCEEFLKLKGVQGVEIKRHIQSKLPRGANFEITKVKNNWLEQTCN